MVIKKYRQARKILCKRLGINMKQLKKRRVLKDYEFNHSAQIYLKIK